MGRRGLGRPPILAAKPVEDLKRALLPRDGWKLLPPASDRAAWAAIPLEARRAAIAEGEKHLSGDWPVLPAVRFLDFRRNGNRSRYEALRSARRTRLRRLVVAECIENEGRFLDEILNGVWATCEETYWGVPAHMSLQKAGTGLPDVSEPTVDLFAADTGSLLAWTDFLLAPDLEKLSPLLRPRIAGEIERRILKPCRERSDFWWMGLDPGVNRRMNNWNPWINSNWLTCVLLVEADSERRAADVHKILKSLDRFLDAYYDDGGCEEGPGYWNHAGGSLFECLELLHAATGGAFYFYDHPLIREIAAYLYRAHIADDWYMNFADASAKVAIQGPLVYRYGRAVKDAKLAAHGAWAASRVSTGRRGTDSIARELSDLFLVNEIAQALKQPALVRDTWLPGTQVFAARMKEGSAEGLFLGAQGGHNNESHNHNDVGNFLVYLDGRPLLVDVGVGEYTAQTFSAKRYDIWTMQSAYHNCPTIGGVTQQAGEQFAARDARATSDDSGAEFSLELAAAYPASAGIEFWRRTVRLDRKSGEVWIDDMFKLKRAVRVEFNLMTPCVAVSETAGQLRLRGGLLEGRSAVLLFDPRMMVAIDEIPLEDSRLRSVWGSRIFRIKLSLREVRSANCRLRVLKG
jgi:hypothetical protein